MSNNNFKPTVMPKDESLAEQTGHGGAPGLARPANPESIEAFRNISEVSAKDLNAQLQAKDEARIEAKGGHGLQRVEGTIPHEAPRDAGELNAALQAKDEARRNPQNAVPGIVHPGAENLAAFKRDD